MRFVWIIVLALGCRGALRAPPPVCVAAPVIIVVVQPAPPVVAPPEIGWRCDPACRGTMNRLPGPGDCDDCPPGYSEVMPLHTR
jgi:hypothetical protein